MLRVGALVIVRYVVHLAVIRRRDAAQAAAVTCDERHLG